MNDSLKAAKIPASISLLMTNSISYNFIYSYGFLNKKPSKISNITKKKEKFFSSLLCIHIILRAQNTKERKIQ